MIGKPKKPFELLCDELSEKDRRKTIPLSNKSAKSAGMKYRWTVGMNTVHCRKAPNIYIYNQRPVNCTPVRHNGTKFNGWKFIC